ncbi:uncharacterized protein TNCV_958621 [Trichonephila clavipes]|nr:uncharacterized protein TNCV_958621 [Trichonephila clavipes]
MGLVVRAPDFGPEGLDGITSAGNWRKFPSTSVPFLNCGGGDRWWCHLSSFREFTELNRTVTCMVLKAKTNDRRTSSHCHDEFRGPRCHFVRQDPARRRFVEWSQNEIAVVPDFHKRILFSDEAHFWLNGYVNKQNGRIWSEANPQVCVETPLHPEKLTVWCALWAGGILLQKR